MSRCVGVQRPGELAVTSGYVMRWWWCPGEVSNPRSLPIARPGLIEQSGVTPVGVAVRQRHPQRRHQQASPIVGVKL